MARGGKRTPRNPAAESGPGKLSRRTDGGPEVGVYASPEGERPYGERKAVEAQAAAGPTQGSGPPQQAAAAGGDPRLAAALQEGVFGPTRRPGEAPTAGMPFGAGPGPTETGLPEDPDLLLRALIQAYPHPDLVRLLNRG